MGQRQKRSGWPTRRLDGRRRLSVWLRRVKLGPGCRRRKKQKQKSWRLQRRPLLTQKRKRRPKKQLQKQRRRPLAMIKSGLRANLRHARGQQPKGSDSFDSM